MQSGWYHLFDLLKIVLPLLLFFFLFKSMIEKNSNSILSILNSKINEKRASSQLSIRLQALERMALYIERINLQALNYRLNQANLTVKELYFSMIIAMQEELEHNITQQLYISDNLWKIINACRDHQISLLEKLQEGLSSEAPSSELSDKINWYASTQNDAALNTARKAIKEESKVLL